MSLSLVHETVSTASLTVRDDQREALAFATDELLRYVAIITGASLPLSEAGGGPQVSLEIRPGPSEGYGWEITEERLALHGTDRLQVLFAVYHFLERHCGVVWLAEGDGGEIVPRLETLILPEERFNAKPVFAHRAFTNYPTIDRNTALMVDWMAKNRCNRFMIFANAGDSLARYEQFLRAEITARGMHVELGHHSFRTFLPPDEYFADHPEYYALQGDERTTQGQVCTSNPEVVRVMAERVCETFARHPEIDTIGLWPNDGYGWCECEACQAQEPQQPASPYSDYPRRTDTYLRFVNQIAALVAERFPERFLSALAYVNYVEPPAVERPAANVKICFAPFQRCFKHPWQAPEECSRPNADYAAMIRRWREVTPGSLYVFEYLMLIDMMSVPYPLLETIATDLAFLAEVGVDGWVLEYKPEEWGPYGLHAHLLAGLSWQAHEEAEAIARSYWRALVGDEAERYETIRHLLAERVRDDGPCVHHYDLSYTRRCTALLLRPILEELGRMLLPAAASEQRCRQAVQRLQVSLQLLLKLGQWQEELAQAAGKPTEASEQGRALIAWIRSQAKSGAVDAETFARRVEDELARLV